MNVQKQYLKVGAALCFITGLVSSVLSIITINTTGFNWPLGIGILCLITAGVIFFQFIMPKDNLPDDIDEVVSELRGLSTIVHYQLVFPCDKAHHSAANKLAKEKFGKNSVSTKIVNDWKRKNSLLVTCLLEKNRFVGYFDILPLETSFALKLISGEQGENDIRADHILSEKEMRNAEYLYFAGIAIKDPYSPMGNFHATYLLHAAALYIKLAYGESPKLKKILTIPTSDCGLVITKHLGFILEKDATLRTDRLDLYSKPFDLAQLSLFIEENKRIYARFDAEAYYNFYFPMKSKQTTSYERIA